MDFSERLGAAFRESIKLRFQVFIVVIALIVYFAQYSSNSSDYNKQTARNKTIMVLLGTSVLNLIVNYYVVYRREISPVV